MTVLLTRKAVLQVAMETTYDTPASVGTGDGALVDKPTFTVKPNVLERNFVRADLSPMAHIIGRKLAGIDFETELRGNGKQNSGVATDAPLISRMFRACGYALTAYPGPNIKGPFVIGDPPLDVGWVLSSGVHASDILTLVTSDNFADGEHVVVGGKTYAFEATLTNVDGNVKLGIDGPTSLANLDAAINLSGVPGTNYAVLMSANTQVRSTYVAAAYTLLATALATGSAGNSITATTTALHGTWATATLLGGVTAATNTDAISYNLLVTTPGASGVAAITVTSDTAGESSASAVVTSGTAFPLGTKGLTITPTWTGNLVDGMQWVLWLMPPGISLDPISDNFESVTLVLHKDGVKHVMPGSFGTFEITAQAGAFATVKWTFTGTYSAPTDEPNPLPVFERTLPSQVELARLQINQFHAVVEKFTFNQANDIQIRPDVSSSDGYIGTRIVSRKPVGGIDPEADTVANQDFWSGLATALRMPFQMRVGYLPGNTVWVLAPCTQYTGMTYADRNGILVYDAGLSFSRVNGNDEVSIYLM